MLPIDRSPVRYPVWNKSSCRGWKLLIARDGGSSKTVYLHQAPTRGSAIMATTASGSTSPPRRTSTPITRRSTDMPPRSFSDPLTVTRCAGPQVMERKVERRVPYGPGFYIPPPGYQCSSLAGGRWEPQTVGCCDRLRPRAETTTAGYATPTKPPPRSSREQARRPRSKQPRANGASAHGRLITWSVLALLFAASQMALLARYTDGGVASNGLIWGAMVLELYAGLVSTIGLLLVMMQSEASNGSKQTRRKSITSSLLSTLPTVSGIAVCLGAALQLASLTIYALQSPEKSITYSIVTALATSLLITLSSIGWNLHHDGHLCRARRKPRSKRADAPPYQLPVTNPDAPPSRSSSLSSHSGKYVPDYGLDSDSDSDSSYDEDGKPGHKGPRADWMDRVLDPVVHSPLLDVQSRR